ncbi:centrosomal protein POC5-like isoform X2 [Tachypleus tridentatus]|uniref:centrosomal protein POC5-like isoform X2 n=1 Tax=Tachypleus tridentatus TaxID=6853 RepID=UPI003FCFA7B5
MIRYRVFAIKFKATRYVGHLCFVNHVHHNAFDSSVSSEMTSESVGKITPTADRPQSRDSALSDVLPVSYQENYEELLSYAVSSVQSPNLQGKHCTAQRKENLSREKNFTVQSSSLPSVLKHLEDESKLVQEVSINMNRYCDDPDLKRIEVGLSNWCEQLKEFILSEVIHVKIQVQKQFQQQLDEERKRYASENIKMSKEVVELNNLITSYEDALKRKDYIINNLSKAVTKQQEKLYLLRVFYQWKIQCTNKKRVKFTSALAAHYRQQRLRQKVCQAWHRSLESSWKERIEKKYQAKTQDLCDEHSKEVTKLKEVLAIAKQKLVDLTNEKTSYEDNMKRALMRGVCALNLEALGVFYGSEECKFQQGGNTSVIHVENRMSQADKKMELTAKPSTSSDHSWPEITNITAGDHHNKNFSCQTSTEKENICIHNSRSPCTSVNTIPLSGTVFTSALYPTAAVKKAYRQLEDIALKSRADELSCKKMGLNPPMASVVVERHLPINKETIGHAMAIKYSRTKNTRTTSNIQGNVLFW